MSYRLLGHKPGARCLPSILAKELPTLDDVKLFVKDYVKEHYPDQLWLELHKQGTNDVLFRVLSHTNAIFDDYQIKAKAN